ncbi:50S ribosomal protein L4 [bacterium]|nr:MAG: 50S ribosomal protein L4 [bacterium]
MAKVSILNWDKKSVGEVELPAAVFEQPVRKDLLHTVVRWQLACRRQGTAMSKTKGLVSGGGKKPFKQKGTGNARQGSTRSPLNPGGGAIFGPEPRDYSYKLPRKVKQAALRTALSYLQGAGKLFIVEDMKSQGKTGELAKRLKTFGVAKAVLIDQANDAMFDRASRNMTGIRYYSVDGLNVLDLLKYDTAIVTKASLERILSRCGVEA